MGFDQGLLLYMKRRLRKIQAGEVELRDGESETALSQRIKLLDNKIQAEKTAKRRWRKSIIKSIRETPKSLCINAFNRVNEALIYPLSQLPL